MPELAVAPEAAASPLSAIVINHDVGNNNKRNPTHQAHSNVDHWNRRRKRRSRMPALNRLRHSSEKASRSEPHTLVPDWHLKGATRFLSMFTFETIALALASVW